MGPHAVTGRDAARDELRSEIADATEEWDLIQNSVTRETWEGTQQEHLADWLLSRGYRRSVTPDQIEAASAVSWGAYWNPAEAPWQEQSRSRRETWAVAVSAAARAFGLEVTE